MGKRLVTAMALALAAAIPSVAPAQDARPSTPADTRGLVSVQDAINTLQKPPADERPSPNGPATPVPIGNVGQWFGAADYPVAALRAGQQGRVVATLAIDAAGRVTGCQVPQSSGSVALDEATCRIARAKMSFKPAHDAAGHTLASTYRLSIRWILPNDAPAIVPMMTALVSIGEDGAILSCVKQSAGPSPDICAAFPKGEKVPGLEAMKGKVIMLATLMRPLADQ